MHRMLLCNSSMITAHYREDYSQMWKSCEISTPKLCDLPAGSYPDLGKYYF